MTPTDEATISPPLSSPTSSLPPEAFHGLLTDPVGEYGRVSYGGGMAVTLRGSQAFLARASNLFSTFCGEIWSSNGRSARKRQTRQPVFHPGEPPNTLYFGLTERPEERIKAAVRLYLYSQLCKAKAERTYVRDEDGDVINIQYTNEDALMEEATQLSQAFYDHHMVADYRIVPDNASFHPTPVTEYALLEPTPEPEEDKAWWEELRPSIA